MAFLNNPDSKFLPNSLLISICRKMLVMEATREVASVDQPKVGEAERVPELAKKMVTVKLEPMCRRVATGSKGQKVSLLANHFKVETTNVSSHFYCYNVDIVQEDGRPVSGKGIGQRIVGKVQETYAAELDGKNFAYDGAQNLYTLGSLPHNKFEFLVALPNVSSNSTCCGERDQKRQRSGSPARTYRVVISFVARFALQGIRDALRGQGSENSSEVLRVLNIILTQHAAKQGCLVINRSFFQNEPKNFTPLGGGVLGCKGFHSSLGVTQLGLSLNFDTSITTIIQPGPVIDFLAANQNVRDCSNINWNKAKQTLKNLRMKVSTSNKEYKISGLSKKPCKEETFLWEVRDHNSIVTKSISITVYDYFVNHRHIALRYSADFPCIDVGKPKRPTYIPIEICSLVSLQRYREELTVHQRVSLAEKSSQRPQERTKILSDALKQNNYNADALLHSCGMSINDNFSQVEGRVLTAPRLRVGNGEEIIPRNGKWSFNNKKFFDPAKLKKWVVVNFSSPCDVNFLYKGLIKVGESRGMAIDPPKAVFQENPQFRKARATVRVEKMFEQIHSRFPKHDPAYFILCLLPDRKTSRIYGPWKRKTLVDNGIFNQCVAPIRSANEQYLSNVMLKINAKLGGLNSVLGCEHRRNIPLVSEVPTMIFGMDVSHSQHMPSIAAVVGSRHWPLVSRYRASLRMQQHGCEIIDSIFKPLSPGKDAGIFRELLLDFYASSGKRKPSHIIIFRDGVGNSEFSQVLNIELDQMNKACKFLDESWSPKFTVIISVKRHHTRFFQLKCHENVPPGTIIDNGVCHPRNYDFYMCPHVALKGTLRPIHYHVLVDEIGFKDDQLQKLIHHLSYVFQRSTSTISEVAPVRYAHLAAAQVSRLLDFGEMSSGSELHENVRSSMFFC